VITRELTIRNKSGLHARPATLWVQTANKFQSSIRLQKTSREVDGKSLLNLLTLGLTSGSIARLTVDGVDEQEAVAVLEQLLADLEAKGE
jgi:phosphocarrier protein HPr